MSIRIKTKNNKKGDIKSLLISNSEYRNELLELNNYNDIEYGSGKVRGRVNAFEMPVNKPKKPLYKLNSPLELATNEIYRNPQMRAENAERVGNLIKALFDDNRFSLKKSTIVEDYTDSVYNVTEGVDSITKFLTLSDNDENGEGVVFWDDETQHPTIEKQDSISGYIKNVNYRRSETIEKFKDSQYFTIGNSFNVKASGYNGYSINRPSVSDEIDTVNFVQDNSYYVYNELNKFSPNNLTNVDDGTTLSALGDDEVKKDSLIAKTHNLFKEGRIGSIVSRFKTDINNAGTTVKREQTQSAWRETHGLSRGRNLLKKTGSDSINGYDNPYCRVWTSHYQYSKYEDAIRPFGETTSELQDSFGKGMRPHGGKPLEAWSTLNNSTGLPKIAPTSDAKGEYTGDITKCMFSIENLAWKDLNYNAKVGDFNGEVLPSSQRGPNGGRIMWFPPYNIKFSENVGVQWESNSFIGRGEQVYTYTNTERSGTLDFTLLIDHPSIIDRWANSIGQATQENEDDLLRFFAGCDTLEVNSGTEEVVDEEKISKYTVEDILVADPVKSVYEPYIEEYYVFFPNNFSGIDFIAGENGALEAAYYLLNGYPKSGNKRSGGELGEDVGYEMVNSSGIKRAMYSDYISGQHFADQPGRRKIYYQVDNRVKNEYGPEITKDKKSFRLNTTSGLRELIRGNDIVVGVLQINTEKIDTIFGFNDLLKKNVNNLSDIKKHYNVTARCIGYASSHGHSNSNIILAKNRAQFLAEIVRQLNIVDKPEDVTFVGDREIPVGKTKDTSGLIPKLGRYAKVVITYTPKEDINIDLGEDGSYTEDNVRYVISGGTRYRVTGTRQVQDGYEIKRTSRTISKDDKAIPDDEYLYFKTLKRDNPLLFENIVNKIRYFDPAFHSITPEGFNARLTFLHQCTRQGPTTAIAEDDHSSMGAGNLAFGRMPVCVLRIGDFYNTKIIIDSLSISYDNGGGVQWDMNPEGIGLQPMVANITIGFKFLGGSDLSGPIARLQNAVSMNYYANTSVYDRRADYRGSGNTESIMAWNPMALDENNNTRHIDFKP